MVLVDEVLELRPLIWRALNQGHGAGETLFINSCRQCNGLTPSGRGGTALPPYTRAFSLPESSVKRQGVCASAMRD